MKKGILAGAAALGLSVTVAVIGPAFAGMNVQDHWTSQPQYEQALEAETLPPLETGTLQASDAVIQAAESDVRSGSQAGGTAALDADPRWREAGGE